MPIKLLQWNILYKEKIEHIVRLVKELNPDIVCMQELGVNCRFNPSVGNMAEYVKENLGYNSFFGEAQRWKQDSDMDAIGNGIFTRFPIVKTFTKHIQEQTQEFVDYSHEGRVYVEADVQVGDKVVLKVGTVHLSYTHKFEVTEEKKQEVDNLLKLVKGNKEGFIFSGDLNSTPDSYTIAELNKQFAHAGPDYEQPTWTTKPFSYKGFEEDELRWRLDYVFVTKDVNIVSSKIIKTQFSDHLPILVEFSI